MKPKSELLVRLEKWLKKPGNSEALLAGKLGYKTSATVAQWIRRGNIPQWQRDSVKRILSSS